MPPRPVICHDPTDWLVCDGGHEARNTLNSLLHPSKLATLRFYYGDKHRPPPVDL